MVQRLPSALNGTAKNVANPLDLKEQTEIHIEPVMPEVPAFSFTPGLSVELDKLESS
jgi:hypothetical protein